MIDDRSRAEIARGEPGEQGELPAQCVLECSGIRYEEVGVRNAVPARDLVTALIADVELALHVRQLVAVAVLETAVLRGEKQRFGQQAGACRSDREGLGAGAVTEVAIGIARFVVAVGQHDLTGVDTDP